MEVSGSAARPAAAKSSRAKASVPVTVFPLVRCLKTAPLESRTPPALQGTGVRPSGTGREFGVTEEAQL